MATVKTNDSRTRNARNLMDSFNECDGDANAYVFIGGVSPWENEDEPPEPVNNIDEYYKVHGEMLSLKRVNDLDVHYMIPKVKWISGTVFDMYRHDYSSENAAHSGAFNLYDAIYYVLSENNFVYVCLDNNNEKPSLVEPQNISDAPFFTSDGYQWLKLFRVDDENQKYYSTTNLLPIVDTEVISATEGTIHTVVVNQPGTRYTNNPGGPIADVPDYYCRIVGDGEGAVAKVRVRMGGVDSVQVVRPGSGYTHAKLDFVKNRVYKGLTQLDQSRNPLNPLGEGDFKSTVIISPPGGWGYKQDDLLSVEENATEARHRLALQLSSRTVGVFSSFKDPLLDAYPDTTFRQIGILHDVVATHGNENAYSLSAVHSVKVENVVKGKEFVLGEMIEQEVTNTDSSLGKYAIGKVVSWDQNNLILRYVQNRDTVNEEGNTLIFKGDKLIVGRDSDFSVKVDNLYDESLEGTNFFRGYADPEIVKNRGYITYLANVKPIKRAYTQTERISLTITF